MFLWQKSCKMKKVRIATPRLSERGIYSLPAGNDELQNALASLPVYSAATKAT
jgi:hypothetical protein